MNLNLKKPCKNCPFLKVGAIELRRGRVDAIARGLIEDDTNPFLCHKTVYSKKSDGVTVEHEDGSTTYQPGKKDSVCAGSMVFLLKARSPNVAMRMGAAFGMIDFKELEAQVGDIIDPSDLDLETRAGEARERRNRLRHSRPEAAK